MTANGSTMDDAMAAGILELVEGDGRGVAVSLRAVADQPAVADVLRVALATVPAVESLEIAMADTATDAAAIMRTLLDRPRPGLRHLTLRESGFDPAAQDTDADRAAVSAEDLAGFGTHLPDLDQLDLSAPCFARGLVHPTLRCLVLCGVSFEPCWRGIELPSLERLRWWLPGDVYGVGVDPEWFDPFWTADAFPRLTELDLLDADFDGTVFTPAMLGSPLLRRLEVLRVPFVDDPAPVAQLAHLRRIEVRGACGATATRALPMIRVVTEPAAARVAGPRTR